MKITSASRLAVVTGAAGGLGLAFAHQLAARGYRLLLVDRRQGPLEQACASITAQHGIDAEPIAVDLCQRDQVEQLAAKLEHAEDIDLLVNNAGFGTVDYFVDTDASFLVGMVDVHIVAPTLLTRAVLPGMVERNRGNIINVSSMGAWLHSAGNAQYGATKNYLTVFTDSLAQELRGTDVRVQVLCPGFVKTEFHSGEQMTGFHQCAPAARMWMSPDEVADFAVRSMMNKRVIVIPGFGYRIFGRLAQMPFLQPLLQWITRVPRRTRAVVPVAVERCPEPVLVLPKKA